MSEPDHRSTDHAAHAGGWFTGNPRALAWVWVLYLLPRCLVLLIPVTPISDADFYFTRAAGLAAGHGYLSVHGVPTAYWPPGWPMMLSLIFDLTGPSPLAAGLLNLACAVLAGWLVHDLGRRIFASESAGRWALLLLALYPNNVGYVPLAMTEHFYAALLLAICWLLIAREGRAWAFVLAGLLLGLAVLVKAQSLLVVPLILGIGLLRETGFWRRLPRAAFRLVALSALAVLVVTPWTLRNMRELHQFVALSTNGGITLLAGNNDDAHGTFTVDTPVIRELGARRGLDEIGFDKEAGRLGKQWIATHPAQFAKLIPMKLFSLWAPDGEAQWAFEGGYPAYSAHAGLFRAVRIFNQAWYFMLLGFAGLAAVLSMRQRRAAGQRWIDWWLLPYAVAAYPSAIAVVFFGMARFHFVAMPFLCMAAGWAVAQLVAKFRPA